jgi:transposase InsO family protein
MKRNYIKFRPIRPRSPHLNGKVERSQMTDKIEFYPTVDIDSENLADLAEEWQFDCNWHRPHSSLGGKTPLEKPAN